MKRRDFLRSACLAPFLGVMSQAATTSTFRRAVTFEDAFDASCRVTVDGARGSGTFFGTYDGKGYIFTNYHVVTNASRATLDFLTNGYRHTIAGVVDWRYYDASAPCDFATIVVDARELEKINPPWVALGGADAYPSLDSLIISSGAPDGRFVQSWKGRTETYYNGKTLIFSPPPVPGQSGSGIVERKGDDLFLTGVLTWLIGEKGRDDSKGGAIPIANLYKALENRPATNAGIFDAPAIPPDATECRK